MVEAGKLETTPSHHKIVNGTLLLMYICMIVSALLPFGLIVALTSEIEPTHQMFKDLFDFEVRFAWETIPFTFPLCLGGYAVASIAVFVLNVVSLYYMTTVISTDAFTPQEITWAPNLGPNRSKIATTCCGELNDQEVISLYKTQHVLNILMSSYFR